MFDWSNDYLFFNIFPQFQTSGWCLHSWVRISRKDESVIKDGHGRQQGEGSVKFNETEHEKKCRHLKSERARGVLWGGQSERVWTVQTDERTRSWKEITEETLEGFLNSPVVLKFPKTNKEVISRMASKSTDSHCKISLSRPIKPYCTIKNGSY